MLDDLSWPWVISQVSCKTRTFSLNFEIILRISCTATLSLTLPEQSKVAFQHYPTCNFECSHPEHFDLLGACHFLLGMCDFMRDHQKAIARLRCHSLRAMPNESCSDVQSKRIHFVFRSTAQASPLAFPCRYLDSMMLTSLPGGFFNRLVNLQSL